MEINQGIYEPEFYKLRTASVALYLVLATSVFDDSRTIRSSNKSLMDSIRMTSFISFNKARKELIDLGLIKYTRTGTRSPGIYEIF